jgi:hypothetical protein
MGRKGQWAARVAASLGVAGALIVVPLGAAEASAAEPGVVTNCGTVTCSDYVSREGTRQMLDLLNSSDNPTALLSSTACAIGGGTKSPVCRVTKVAIRFGEAMTRRTLEDAVGNHPPNGACFKTTYLKRTGVITYVSTNNGRYCHDT